MKIAVMGAGAIGGYFGGRLAKAVLMSASSPEVPIWTSSGKMV